LSYSSGSTSGTCAKAASYLARLPRFARSSGNEPPDLAEAKDLKTFFQAIQILNEAELLLAYPDRSDLHRGRELQGLWSETSYHLQSLRDNPLCAQQEYEAVMDMDNPGLSVSLSYAPHEAITAPYIKAGVRPAIAILREQGVNGQVEMAVAFDHAGFAAVDVHPSDIVSGRVSLRDFRGFAACRGFSYGDVLGAGGGWAYSLLYNSRAREEFSTFFARADTFALGICNGCQMLSRLRALIDIG
jgi:phosphoribosylformylglycinamidine synthase